MIQTHSTVRNREKREKNNIVETTVTPPNTNAPGQKICETSKRFKDGLLGNTLAWGSSNSSSNSGKGVFITSLCGKLVCVFLPANGCFADCLLVELYSPHKCVKIG